MAQVQYRMEARPPYRDVLGRFARAEDDLVRAKRDEIRHLAKRFKEIAQDEAPKKTGDFARGIFYRTYVSGDTTGFTAGGPQPLSNFIRFGTRPHAIHGNPILRFYWDKVGEVVYRRSVFHPGTEPNDFLARAHERWQGEAQAALNRIALRWQRSLS